MSTPLRMMIGIMVTIAVGIAGIIYYRAFPPLRDLATGDFAGPFTSAVTALDNLVPVTLLVILAGTWFWVLSGGVQQERARVRP